MMKKILFSLTGSNKFKKLMAMIVVAAIVSTFFTSEPDASKTDVKKQSTTQANIPPASNPNPNDQTPSDAEPFEVKKPSILKAISIDDNLIYETKENVTNFGLVPIDIIERPLTAKTGYFLKELHDQKKLSDLLKDFQGFGRIVFYDKSLKQYAPNLLSSMFKNFPSDASQYYYWQLISGSGELSLNFQRIPNDLFRSLQANSLLHDKLKIRDNNLIINLNNVGPGLDNQAARALSALLSSHSDRLELNQANLTGSLSINFKAINFYFATSIYKYVQSSIADKSLARLLETIAYDGYILITLDKIFYPPAWTNKYINADKLKKTYVPINQIDDIHEIAINFKQDTPTNEVISHYNNLAKLLPNEMSNMKLTGYLTLPIKIYGKHLIRYFRRVNEINHNFQQQETLAPGTKVYAKFDIPLSSFNENTDPAFLDALDLLHVDQFMFRSLYSINDQAKFILHIEFNSEKMNQVSSFIYLLSHYLSQVAAFVNHSFEIEIPKELYQTSAIQSLKTKYGSNGPKWIVAPEKIQVKLNLMSIEEARQFQSLANDLHGLAGVKFIGDLEMPVTEIKSNVYARQIIEYLVNSSQVSTFTRMLTYLRGDGQISLFPHPSAYKQDQTLQKIFTLLKHNPEAKKTWDMIMGEFEFQIPEDFSGEAKPGSIRYLYEYIHSNGNENLKKKRIAQVVEYLKGTDKKDHTMPGSLDSILDLLSEDQQISETLEDWKSEKF